MTHLPTPVKPAQNLNTAQMGPVPTLLAQEGKIMTPATTLEVAVMEVAEVLYPT
jgi:hypothetical protein